MPAADAGAVRPLRQRARQTMAAGALLAACAITLKADQQFRASVSLVAVDVQVVDEDGRPLERLQPADFEVTIGGRRRRVTSAEFIRHSETAATTADIAARSAVTDGVASSSPASRSTGRQIVLVIDSESLDPGVWQRAGGVVQGMLRELQPDDRVGLFVSPLGPVMEPSVDHARIARAVAGVVTRGLGFMTQFNLRPGEVVDIAAEGIQLRSPGSALRRTRQQEFDVGSDTPTVQAVHMRECPDDPQCPGQILLEATSAVQELETRAQASVMALRQMTALLAAWPSRKTVVLLSGGVTVSDRPGGRPDPPDLTRVLGENIARTNAAIYTLHLSLDRQDGYSATRRVVARAGSDDVRERSMQSAWLERFSEAAGGSLFRVERDSGEEAWQRILQETSAYYLLGVEPAAEDRDSRPRALRVRVRADDTTVRSRSWVVVGPE